MTVRYLTSPIYYLNGEPHLGHAYTTIATDVLARYWRLQDGQVKFLTGTDEHGQKIAQAAEAKGQDPQAYVDHMAEIFKNMAEKVGSSHDVFIRTTESRHYKAAQALWQKLVENGQIYLGSYAGWYAVRDEAFYDASEIVNGLAPTGAPVEWVEEPTYFFKLSLWQEALLKYYEDHPDAVAPSSRRNEVLGFIKGGLKDLSVSRSNLTWGIPVPGDPTHVMYVWIDALTNYITALGYPDSEGNDFKIFWPESIHLIGKDILRFHAVYWPAFLMAAGITPPKRIFAHGWWTHNGEKMSKSLGNSVDPLVLIEKYGLDQVRYFLIREVSFGQDGDFSEDLFIQRINSNLANDLGNLVQRVLSFIYKNTDGTFYQHSMLTVEDQALLDKTYDLKEILYNDMEIQALHQYCIHIWDVIGEANRYVDYQKPWSLRKSENQDDRERMQTVLYVLGEVIRHVAIYLQPLMPSSAEKILDIISETGRKFSVLDQPLKPGTKTKEPYAIFPRIEMEKN